MFWFFKNLRKKLSIVESSWRNEVDLSAVFDLKNWIVTAEVFQIAGSNSFLRRDTKIRTPIKKVGHSKVARQIKKSSEYVEYVNNIIKDGLADNYFNAFKIADEKFRDVKSSDK